MLRKLHNVLPFLLVQSMQYADHPIVSCTLYVRCVRKYIDSYCNTQSWWKFSAVPSDFSFVAFAQENAPASRSATKMFAKVDKC